MKHAFDFADYSNFTSKEPFDFKKNSAIGCGGEAAIAFYPESVEEVAALIEKLNKDGIKYHVLGNLSNVLPPDGFLPFAVIHTKKLVGMAFGETVFAYAGTTSGALLRACRREKRGGAEFLSGIPCTIGGALYMNAGADGKYVAEIVENVLVLREGKKRILSLEECQYSYKKSLFMENEDVILGASLRLERTTEEDIAKREAYYQKRRLHLPKGKSMGCVFKNPQGSFAGALIEGCGLKGMRIGGAQISKEHANFIINDKGATSTDVRSLITLAKNAVYSQYGICLEEEIRYLN